MNSITIAAYQEGLKIALNEDGVLFSLPISVQEDEAFDAISQFKGEAGTVAALIPILVERDIAVRTARGFLVRNDHVAALYSADYSLVDFLPGHCPFVLQVRSRGNIADGSLRYEYGFYAGFQEVGASCLGTFLKVSSRVYYMPASMFKLVSAMQNFNALPAEKRDKANALLAIAEIKTHSQDCGSILDKYLNSENIVVADKVGVDLTEESDGSVTMSPKVAGVSDEKLQRRYRQLKHVESVYDLDAPDGARIRVVLPEATRELVARMKSVTRVTGEKKQHVLADPMSVFDGVQDFEKLDLESFSPRVRGVGELAFQPRPYVRRSGSSFLDSSGLERIASPEYGLECRTATGDVVNLKFSSGEEFERFKTGARAAFESGDALIPWIDKSGADYQIPLTGSFMRELADIDTTTSDELRNEAVPPEPEDSKKYLLIYDNEEKLDYAEDVSKNSPLNLCYQRPSSLVSNIKGEPFDLKDYQQEGVAWLQGLVKGCFASASNGSRRGCLLADDMGLGKTLQILTFLAWCIETGLADMLGAGCGPYHPILVVAPLVLLQTWRNEITKFFVNDGAVFMPYLLLHGDAIRRIKKISGGREYELGESALDLDAIKQNRVVVTNYDTVRNYQHSFGRIPWSVVICDEAQEIKEPKTTVTWALKSQNSRYRIAMTGTPVENRLLDLWNICDFIQPGLLGSAREFSAKFETGVDEDQAQRQFLAKELRTQLAHDRPNAYILRRQKIDKLQGLPSKSEFIRKSPLTAQQKQLHAQVVSGLKSSTGKSGQHLKAIQRLSKIYQHPSVDLDKAVDKDSKYYVETSQKLADTLSILHEIRSRREKVLIFALLTKMQLILKKVIDDEFGLCVNIVNGSVAVGNPENSLRHKIIEAFESKPGFNVLILSPDVAGVGLTITGANNVIHYGRWWNPAKEAQATDRVYRLGQTRDVNVYYPISVAEEFCSFDERLHNLLLTKRELASDFLVPTGALDVSESELLSGLAEPIETAEDCRAEKIHVKQLSDFTKERLCAIMAATIYGKNGRVCLAPGEQGYGFDFAFVEDGQLRLAIIIMKAADGRAAIELAAKNRSLVEAVAKANSSLVCISPFEQFDRHVTEFAKSKHVKLVDHGNVARKIADGVPYSAVFALEDSRPEDWAQALASLGLL